MPKADPPLAGNCHRPDAMSGRNALRPVVSFALLLGFGLIQEYRVYFGVKWLGLDKLDKPKEQRP